MKQISSISGILGGLLVAVAGLSYLITKEFTLVYQVIGFTGVSLFFFYVYQNIDDITRMLGSRSARYGAYATVLVILAGVVLGLINFIAFRHPKRFDATEAKLFTLSPQTVKVVGTLSEDVQLTTFFLDGGDARERFDDLIEGYRMHSPHIKVTYINPEKNPVVTRQFGITQADTVVVVRGDNEKRVTNMTEEAFTNALIAVTRDTRKQICFLEGHGEHSPSDTEQQGLSEVKSALEKQSFEINVVQLFSTQEIPEGCSVMVMAGPKRPLLDEEKPLLDEWVHNGGRLVLMIDPDAPDELAEYVTRWGVVLHKDLVVDPVAQSFFGNAAVPIAIPSGPNKITQDFQDSPAFFPLARSLDKLPDNPSGGFVEFLLQTASEQAWGETDLSVIDPDAARDEPQSPQFGESDLVGPLNLAALVTIPAKSNAANSGAEDGDEPSDEADENKKPDGMVAIFGDSDFATNAYFYSSINGDLFLNTISHLAEEDDLVAIRARSSDKQTLSMSQAQGNFVAFLSLLIMPAIPMLFGLYTFVRRRNL